jgi:hypothetical protein
MRQRRNRQTEEERCFVAALVVMELHFEKPNSYMRESMVEVKKMVARTLDASLNKSEVRYGFISREGGESTDKGIIGRHWQRMWMCGCICRKSSTPLCHFSIVALYGNPKAMLHLTVTMYRSLRNSY